MSPTNLQNAYQHCVAIATLHYENFPVASRLLPAPLRNATAVIYAFARRADDIVDEGTSPSEQRHSQLNALHTELDNISAGIDSIDPVFIALADVINQFQLPTQPFYDLLIAFRLDIDQSRYATYADLDYYCHHSANPIGRLVLHLHQQATAENCRLADKICTALQLINFAQDLDSDLQQRHRCYVPLDELQCYHLTPDTLLSPAHSATAHYVMLLQLQRSRRLLVKGAPLANLVTGRLRWELRAIVASGWCILNKLTRRATLDNRPTLNLFDGIVILKYILFYNRLIIAYPLDRQTT